MKAKLIAWLGGTSICLLLAGAPLLVTGCSTTEARAPSPNYGYSVGSNAYFNPRTGIYHWYEDGHWVAGHHLPPRYASRTAAPEAWQEQGSAFSDGYSGRPYPYPTPNDFAAHGD